MAISEMDGIWQEVDAHLWEGLFEAGLDNIPCVATLSKSALVPV